MSYFNDNEDTIRGNSYLSSCKGYIKNQLIEYDKPKDVSIDNFLWRTAKEGWIKPSMMETRHLFFSLRMVYNNFVPKQYRHPPVRLYYFDRQIYTNKYMKVAIEAFIIELSKRDDLTPYYKKGLQYIRSGIEALQRGRIEI